MMSQGSMFSAIHCRNDSVQENLQAEQCAWSPAEGRQRGWLSSAHDSATEFDYCNLGIAEDGVSWAGHFPLHRGGKVVFSLSAHKGFTIALQPESTAQHSGPENQPNGWIGIRINRRSVDLVCSQAASKSLCVLSSSFHELAGYREGQPESYWLSFDPESSTLRFGQQSPYAANELLSIALNSAGAKRQNSWIQSELLQQLSQNTPCVQLRDYQGGPVVETTIYEQPLLRKRADKVAWVTIDSEPVVIDLSPRLLPNEAMVLSDLARTDFTFEANLSTAGQYVARRVLQPKLTLKDASEKGDVSLADAIGYSLKQEGAYLHSLLKKKLAAPGSAAQGKITVELAPALGSSPGPSTTLEILPRGYCGAICCNARTYGALKVLHGEIDVSLYNDDVDREEVGLCIDEVDLGKDDAFWFSPSWYQTHSMTCASRDYSCYTLAREYAADDDIRWPFVRCKDQQGRTYDVRPKADCTFSELFRVVRQELEEALAKDPNVLVSKDRERDLARTSSARTEAWIEELKRLPKESPAGEIQTLGGDERSQGEPNGAGLKHALQGLRCWGSRQRYSPPASLSPLPENTSVLGDDCAVSILEDKPSQSLPYLWP